MTEWKLISLISKTIASLSGKTEINIKITHNVSQHHMETNPLPSFRKFDT